MNWLEQGRDPITGCKLFRAGAFTVMVADPQSTEYKETGRWHLSISHPIRYPKWDEIADARYSLIPNEITMMMYLPPREESLTSTKTVSTSMNQGKNSNEIQH